MDVNLKEMLKGAMAIPYSEELIAALEDSCREFNTNDEFRRVDDLVVGFVTGNIPADFRSHVDNAMKEQDFSEIPTTDVFIRLAQYVVLVTVLENEVKLNRTICASKLMNYILVAKALKRPIPNMDALLEVYKYHLSAYLEEVDQLKENIQTNLRAEIPDEDFPLEIPEKDADELRLVFKEAELYRIERLLASAEIQQNDNPFVRVYDGLSKMFDGLSYPFYDLDMNRIIGLLIGDKDEKKRRKLSNIIEDLVQAGCKYKSDCGLTSVILRMINGRGHENVGDVILPIREFAVYLYYELLTEKIIATQN